MLCLALGGGAAVAGYSLVDRGDKFPKQWEPRIEPLAREVERLRGLKFKHAVTTTFYPDAEFTERVTNDDEPSEQDRADLDRFAGAFRAIGLAEGDVDLQRDSNTLRGSGVLAYYDTDEKRIHIRGTEMTLSVQVTLVHELTHALQDQHFDLAKLRALDAANKTEASKSLIEGDATWVEDEYIERSLSKKQRRDYEQESKKGGEEYDDEVVGKVPDILILDQQAAYQFGSAAIAMLRNEGGQRAVDAVFRKPPTADFVMMNPIWLIEDRTKLNAPELAKPDRAKNYELTGEFGAAWWFSMLSERIDFHDALEATDSWASDSSAIYELDDKVCVELGWDGTDRVATENMDQALRQWREAMPDTRAVVVTRVDDDSIKVKACDPGRARSTVTHRSRDAFVLPLFRAGLAAALVDQGAPPHTAWCTADEALKPFSVAELNSNSELFETDRYQRHLRDSAKLCKTRSVEA